MRTIILAITLAVTISGDPTHFSSQHVRLSEEFYPETARDVIIDPADNSVGKNKTRVNRSVDESTITQVTEDALAKVLVALRFLHLLKPLGDTEDEKVIVQTYRLECAKRYQYINLATKHAYAILSRNFGLVADNKTVCDSMMKMVDSGGAKKPKDALGWMKKLRLSIGKVLLDIVDECVTIILKKATVGQEDANQLMTKISIMQEGSAYAFAKFTFPRTSKQNKELKKIEEKCDIARAG